MASKILAIADALVTELISNFETTDRWNEILVPSNIKRAYVANLERHDLKCTEIVVVPATRLFNLDTQEQNVHDYGIDVVMRLYVPDLERFKTWTAPKAEIIE